MYCIYYIYCIPNQRRKEDFLKVEMCPSSLFCPWAEQIRERKGEKNLIISKSRTHIVVFIPTYKDSFFHLGHEQII